MSTRSQKATKTLRRAALARAGALFSAFAMASVLTACAPSERHSLSWSISFANDATRARAERVEVSIARENCTSDEVVYRASIARGAEAERPPALGPGRYGLIGRARTADCRAIAYGCVQVVLPTTDGASYEIVLDDVPETPVCDGECSAQCSGAELDAGALADAAPADSAFDGDAPDDADAAPDLDAGTSPPCTDGVVGPSNHCYRFVTSSKQTWQDAEDDCVSWGGHLVSFNDQVEELWVTDQTKVVPGFDVPARFWIGFSDGQVETVWLWSDGSNREDNNPGIIVYNLADPGQTRFKVPPFVQLYTHWGPNPASDGNSEPNNGGGDSTAVPGEDCAESRADRISGPNGMTPRPEWDDTSCTGVRHYVCER